MCEIRYLGQLCEISTGNNNRDEACNNGKYPFFVRSKDVLAIDNYSYNENAVIIPGEGAVGDVFHYVNGKYGLHQRAYRIHPNTSSLNCRYLYYYMFCNFKSYILKKTVGATSLSIRKPMLEQFVVVVPHIKVQEEIVKILDSFTNLIDALNEELSLRQKQFEYYREKLVNSKKCSNTEKLQYFAKIMNGKDYKHLGQGLIPLMGSGGIMGHVDSSLYNKESVLLPRKGSIDKVYYIDEPFWTVDTLYWTMVDEKKIIPKFLYYVLSSIHIENYALQGGIPSMTQSILYNIDIPNIDKNIQQSIVSKLDAFESLISSLKEEIALRQKQYEYYREKLLTFE